MPGRLSRAATRSSTPPERLLRTALILILVFDLAAVWGCRAQRTSKARTDGGLPGKPPAVRLLRPAAPGSFVRVLARIRPALVHLHASSPVAGGPQSILPSPRSVDAPFFAASPLRERVQRSLGTGVIITRQGHVITASSVIRNAPDVRARLHDGTTLSTRLIGQDADTGIAVLQLAGPGDKQWPGLAPATMGDSEGLRPGDWVVAVGIPFGAAPYASAGLVGSPGASRGLTLARPGYFSFIASDARINLGNAGGPLIDTSGQVVGINVAYDDRDHPMGFSVPVNLIRDVLPTLLKHGQVARSWVGIYVKPVSASVAERAGLGSPRGALVSEVVPRGPAALAGIQPGDIVLEFDGTPIARHMDLTFTAARTPSGKTVPVKLWRDRREHLISLRLERKPQ